LTYYTIRLIRIKHTNTKVNMSTEIELKAWVQNHETVQNKLDRAAAWKGNFEKEDAYWRPEAPAPDFPPSGVRIRKETFTAPDGMISRFIHVTFKSKEVRDGIEINDEKEFDLSSAPEFEELLSRLHLKRGITKRKKGRSYTRGDLSAELTEVLGLGWFAELEILAGDSLDATVREARTRLLGFLAELGIGKDAIETRYYTEMLQANESPQGGAGRR
jgi:adenylate cyclase class 2